VPLLRPMGPPGLWAELRRKGASAFLRGPEVEQLVKGKTVAVDGAVWFYEAQNQPDVSQSYGAEGAVLKVTYERCVRWLRKGVLPVVILEGSGGGRAHRTFSRGYGTLGRAFASQSRVRALLDSLGVPCIDAEGEAEATCATLVDRGICDFVATTDFDALLFGAPRVLLGLDLQARSADSKCELWDTASIERTLGLDRRALIAAAFLVGCDYDCRDASQSTPRDAKGLRGVGSRRALTIAQQLRRVGGGDALKVLEGLLFDSEALGARAIPESLDIVRPESKIVASSMKVDKTSIPNACLLTRTISRLGNEPGCAAGFAATVRQYTRIDTSATTLVGRPFAWKGVDVAAAEVILNHIFPGRTQDKLEPLHFEWAMRKISSECPSDVRADPAKLRRWAAAAGLQFVPISAKRPTPHAAGTVPYAIVEFAPVHDGAVRLRLPAEKKHARLSLAEACSLLYGEIPRTKALEAIFTQLLHECPKSVRQSFATIRDWAVVQGIRYSPSGGLRLRSGRVRISWCTSDSGHTMKGVSLVVAAQDAAGFGGAIAVLAGCSGAGTGQRRLQECFHHGGGSGKVSSPESGSVGGHQIADAGGGGNVVARGAEPPLPVAADAATPRHADKGIAIDGEIAGDGIANSGTRNGEMFDATTGPVVEVKSPSSVRVEAMLELTPTPVRCMQSESQSLQSFPGGKLRRDLIHGQDENVDPPLQRDTTRANITKFFSRSAKCYTPAAPQATQPSFLCTNSFQVATVIDLRSPSPSRAREPTLFSQDVPQTPRRGRTLRHSHSDDTAAAETLPLATPLKCSPWARAARRRSPPEEKREGGHPPLEPLQKTLPSTAEPPKKLSVVAGDGADDRLVALAQVGRHGRSAVCRRATRWSLGGFLRPRKSCSCPGGAEDAAPAESRRRRVGDYRSGDSRDERACKRARRSPQTLGAVSVGPSKRCPGVSAADTADASALAVAASTSTAVKIATYGDPRSGGDDNSMLAEAEWIMEEVDADTADDLPLSMLLPPLSKEA